ncbi:MULTISPECIES: hypothetical protein [Prevotella]|jgi:hypothetical protein|uniref:hypothetical protein n=1 Tax=Prevotella TaxID=838 RepID=UPI001C60763E|nr:MULTISPECIES: hypothetical protein [Prevotella]MBW4733916.1 hypothetical protein [Prevotella melaninogenica]MBW4736300.1 hypothetical protein [Prevotella melaninogenica]MBW4879037.1 hypothetical protein [Prevotella melaninogenica]DAN82947.1 MAG TPA: Mor transcription activator family [Caudoviricetes sp.]
MIVAEFLEKYEAVVKFMNDNHILARDVEFVPLFNKAKEMIARGEKVAYVTSVLSDEYNITDRTVYALIKRLGADLK